MAWRMAKQRQSMCEYINGAIIQEDFTMEKTIFDEYNGLWYELRGDCYTRPRAAGCKPAVFLFRSRTRAKPIPMVKIFLIF